MEFKDLTVLTEEELEFENTLIDPALEELESPFDIIRDEYRVLYKKYLETLKPTEQREMELVQYEEDVKDYRGKITIEKVRRSQESWKKLDSILVEYLSSSDLTGEHFKKLAIEKGLINETV